jgi:hypothetical protein
MLDIQMRRCLWYSFHIALVFEVLLSALSVIISDSDKLYKRYSFIARIYNETQLHKDTIDFITGIR